MTPQEISFSDQVFVDFPLTTVLSSIQFKSFYLFLKCPFLNWESNFLLVSTLLQLVCALKQRCTLQAPITVESANMPLRESVLVYAHLHCLIPWLQIICFVCSKIHSKRLLNCILLLTFPSSFL